MADQDTVNKEITDVTKTAVVARMTKEQAEMALRLRTRADVLNNVLQEMMQTLQETQLRARMALRRDKDKFWAELEEAFGLDPDTKYGLDHKSQSIFVIPTNPPEKKEENSPGG